MSDQVCEKLDVLIRLQAASLIKEMDSTKEKVIFLSKAGLRNNLVAEILGVQRHNVDVTLSAARKSPKKNGGKGEKGS